VSAAISEGSVENIEAIRIADADMILVDQFFSSMAYRGVGSYKNHPVGELRSVTTLWPEIMHLVIRSDRVQTGSLQDLSGKTLATGLPDSGSKYLTELLLGTIDSAGRPVSLRSMSPLAAAEALRNGTVQAVEATGGIPVPMVVMLCDEAKPRVRFLSVPNAQLQAVRDEGWDTVSRMVIPAGTYPGQSEPVETVGEMSILAVAASLNPQVVYALTKIFFENLDYLAKVHPACKNIDLSKAFEGLEIPLHKGAVRYFRERKMKIPERLLQQR
jgi:TRAP transporter TAXI family solute receptor